MSEQENPMDNELDMNELRRALFDSVEAGDLDTLPGDKVVWKGMLYGVSYQEPISKRVRISGLGVASTATVDPDELYASMDEWKAAQGELTAPKVEAKSDPKPVQRITIPKQVQASKIITMLDKGAAQALVAKIRGQMTDLGKSLLELQEREGWKALGYESWRECVMNEFDFGQSRVYQLLDFGRVERNISTFVEKSGADIPIPTTEAQTRPLAKMEAEKQVDTWVAAVKANDNQPPSGAQVKAAAEAAPAPQTTSKAQDQATSL